MSQNDLSSHSMQALAHYLAAYQSSSELQSLVLDKNDLHDEGIRELSVGLLDRFNALENKIIIQNRIF